MYASDGEAVSCSVRGANCDDIRLNQLIRGRLAARPPSPSRFGVATLVLAPGAPGCSGPTLTRRAVSISAPSASWGSMLPRDFSDPIERFSARDGRLPDMPRLSGSIGRGGSSGDSTSVDGRRSTTRMLGYGGTSPISSPMRSWTSRGMMGSPSLDFERWDDVASVRAIAGRLTSVSVSVRA